MILLLAGWACAPGVETRESAPPRDSEEIGETGLDSCFTDPASVEIGTGEEEWEPLPAGAPLTMVHGPQGGWHVLLSARTDDSDLLVRLRLQVQVEGGVTIADNTYQVGLFPLSECSGYYPGMYAYLDVSALAEGERDTPPELLGGEALYISAEMEDESGRTATAESWATARLDPADRG